MTDLTNDTQTDTADSVLTNWQTLSAPLADYVAQASAMKNETESALGALYEHAELSGDDAAKDRVLIAWERTQALHNQIVSMDAGLAGAGATITTLDEQRRAVLNELRSITEALENYDTDHPALEDFAEEVSGMAEEYDYEQFYEEIDERMREIFGEVDDQTSLFTDFIYGEIPLNSVQARLFTQFIDSLRDEDDQREPWKGGDDDDDQ